MKIWQKLGLSWLITSALLSVISILTIKIDKKIQYQTNETVKGIIQEAKAAGDMLNSIQKIQNLNQQLLIQPKNDLLIYSKISKYQDELKNELNQLNINIQKAQEATSFQKQIVESLDENSDRKELKLNEEKQELENLKTLAKEFEIYQS